MAHNLVFGLNRSARIGTMSDQEDHSEDKHIDSEEDMDNEEEEDMDTIWLAGFFAPGEDSDQPTRRSAKRSNSNKKTGKKRKLARNAVFDEFAEEDDSEEEETSGEEGYINEEVSGL